MNLPRFPSFSLPNLCLYICIVIKKSNKSHQISLIRNLINTNPQKTKLNQVQGQRQRKILHKKGKT